MFRCIYYEFWFIPLIPSMRFLFHFSFINMFLDSRVCQNGMGSMTFSNYFNFFLISNLLFLDLKSFHYAIHLYILHTTFIVLNFPFEVHNHKLA